MKIKRVWQLKDAGCLNVDLDPIDEVDLFDHCRHDSLAGDPRWENFAMNMINGS
jgi:hypothetical protein